METRLQIDVTVVYAARSPHEPETRHIHDPVTRPNPKLCSMCGGAPIRPRTHNRERKERANENHQIIETILLRTENLMSQLPTMFWILNSDNLGVKTKLLNNASIPTRRQPRVILQLRSCHDHLSRRENHQRSHLDILTMTTAGRYWSGRTWEKFVHCSENMTRSNAEYNPKVCIELTIQIHSGHDTLKGWNSDLCGGNVLLLEGRRSGRRGDKCLSGGSRDSVSGDISGATGRKASSPTAANCDQPMCVVILHTPVTLRVS